MLHPRDRMIYILDNIYRNLQKDYDYVLVVVGDAGVGKSRLVLQLLDTWYRAILKKPIHSKMISQVNTKFTDWVEQFAKLKQYDMNIFDEGVTGLASTDHMTKISKNITKLFDVMRSDRFFSIIVLPNFFKLNKTFREDRLRGLIYVTRRGKYKYYTKREINMINQYNETRKIKSIEGSPYAHTENFPDYKGIMLKAYLKNKDKGIEEVRDQVITESRMEEFRGKNFEVIFKEDVKELRFPKKGEAKTIKEISEILGISNGIVGRIAQKIKYEQAKKLIDNGKEE